MATALLAMLVVAIGWWWSHPPAASAELRARRLALARLERRPAPELGRGVERWRMIATGGDTLSGIWKPAQAGAGARPWSVVVLGGIRTDERAALLIPDSLSIDVLAMSWPWSGPRRMGTLAFVASLPAIREALLTAPAVMAAGAEAVRSARRGTRVALLGASLGVPVSAAALALTEPDALVLVDGAADLPRLLRSESKRALGGGMAAAVLAAPLGSLAARLLAPLEPSRYAAPPGMPVLIVDAAREERYPPECVARLHATFPGAARHTHPGPHLRPTHGEAIASIVLTVSRWLELR